MRLEREKEAMAVKNEESLGRVQRQLQESFTKVTRMEDEKKAKHAAKKQKRSVGPGRKKR